MELYTSYWQNYDLDGLNMVPVGISRGVPRGKKAKQLPYRYKRLPALFPSSDLLKRWIAREISPDEYTPLIWAALSCPRNTSRASVPGVCPAPVTVPTTETSMSAKASARASRACSDSIVPRRLEVELEHSSFAFYSLEAILERDYEY